MYVFKYSVDIYIFGRAKRAPHWGVQSRFWVIYIVGMSVCLSYVKLTVYAELHGPRACSKSFEGG